MPKQIKLGNAYVYAIAPVNEPDFIFYIGSTKISLAHRFKQHLGDIKRGKHCNPHFARKASKIGLDKLQIIELACVPAGEQFTRENELIAEYTHKAHLTNLVSNSERYSNIASLTEMTVSGWIERILWFISTPKPLDTDNRLVTAMDRVLLKLCGQMFFRPEADHKEPIVEFVGAKEYRQLQLAIMDSPRFTEIYANR